jgi:hypothetical protein
MSMQSQMLIGGKSKVEDTTEFRDMLQEEHKRIRTEYESKLRELEVRDYAVRVDVQWSTVKII